MPNSSPSFGVNVDFDDGLHTPCQNVPIAPAGMSRMSFTPAGRNEWNNNGYRWKDMAKGFLGRSGGEWNRRDEMFFDPSHPREMALGFSREDIEYAKLSEKKNKEVYQSMSDRQKRLLKALEGGKLFKLSKLKIEPDPR